MELSAAARPAGGELRPLLTSRAPRRAPVARLLRLFTRAIAGSVLLLSLGAFSLGLGLHVMGFQSMAVLSGSMQPTMPVGSLLISEPMDASQAKVGDVITFHPPGEPYVVSHRVASRTVVPPAAGLPAEVILVTKGDANVAPDPWRIVASGPTDKMVVALPDLGYALVMMQSRMGKLFILLIPATLLMLLLLAEVWAAPKEGPPEPPLAGPSRPVLAVDLDQL